MGRRRSDRLKVIGMGWCYADGDMVKEGRYMERNSNWEVIFGKEGEEVGRSDNGKRGGGRRLRSRKLPV